MFVYISVLVAVVGLFCYYAATNPKTQEVGRIAFACGLLAFLITGIEPLVKIIGGK